MGKLKTFSIIGTYKSVSLEVFCTTTSKKRFAKFLKRPISELISRIKEYDCNSMEFIVKINTLYARPYIDGEAKYIFTSNEVEEANEYLEVINSHREKYPRTIDYYKEHPHNKK